MALVRYEHVELSEMIKAILGKKKEGTSFSVKLFSPPAADSSAAVSFHHCKFLHTSPPLASVNQPDRPKRPRLSKPVSPGRNAGLLTTAKAAGDPPLDSLSRTRETNQTQDPDSL